MPSEFTVEVKNLSVKYNTASGAGVGGNAVAIDWAPVIVGDTSPLETLVGNVSLTVSGLVRLNLGGYVLAAGSFTLGKSSGSNVTLGSNGSVSFDLLTIDLTGVNLFVGVGASFAGEPE